MANNQQTSRNGSTRYPSTYGDHTGEVDSTSQSTRSSGPRQRMVLREVLDAAISLIDTDDDLIKIGAILGNPLQSIHQEEEEDNNTFANIQGAGCDYLRIIPICKTSSKTTHSRHSVCSRHGDLHGNGKHQ